MKGIAPMAPVLTLVGAQGNLQQRAMEFPDMETQIASLMATIRTRQAKPRPWRYAGVNEALGVPAILGAVTLIDSTVGSMSLEAFNSGVRITDPSQTPRIIQRPNPFTTAYAFFRDTAYHLATRGEFWWWVAARDIDGLALSLFPVPPWEISVEANTRDRLRPTIRWNDRVVRNQDMVHHMYLPDRSGLRGVGPLQLAGAAVSVAVESQEWAANFYAGSTPSIVGETDQDLSDAELAKLDEQWNAKPANLPRWATSGLKVKDFTLDPEKAQLVQSRQFEVGEVARMFTMPGELIEFNMPGSSLQYQNQEGIWADFDRRCLNPHYLEPIEQAMSDLLVRNVTSRFNHSQLLRADAKTRSEVYKNLVDAGVMLPEEARQAEGLAPGNVDFAPTPPSPPQAVPAILAGDEQLRSRSALAVYPPAKCPTCGKRLADAAPPGWRTTCPRCRTTVAAEDDLQQRGDALGMMAMAIMAQLQQRAEAPPVTHIHNTFNMPEQEPPRVEVHPSPITVQPANVTIHPAATPDRVRQIIRYDEDNRVSETETLTESA